MPSSDPGRYKLFLDLDGVLVDFAGGVRRVTGKTPSDQPPQVMWRALARTHQFFSRLKWLPDGHLLWSETRSFSPHIITGLPQGNWAAPQKRAWCQRELGPEIPVTTCMSRDKAHYARKLTPIGVIPVIIDDRTSYQHLWEEMGGIYIVHHSAQSSLDQLYKLFDQ